MLHYTQTCILSIPFLSPSTRSYPASVYNPSPTHQPQRCPTHQHMAQIFIGRTFSQETLVWFCQRLYMYVTANDILFVWLWPPYLKRDVHPISHLLYFSRFLLFLFLLSLKLWRDYRNEFNFCGFYRCVISGESLTN